MNASFTFSRLSSQSTDADVAGLLGQFHALLLVSLGLGLMAEGEKMASQYTNPMITKIAPLMTRFCL